MHSATITEILGGTPVEVAKDLTQFSKSAKVLSSKRERLLEKYEKQWIGLHRGSVEIIGETIDSVMGQLKERGLDPDETIIRYITRDLKTLIL